jgi:hypothetical protein
MFTKILVARHSPQNGCFGEEGDVLYPPVQLGPPASSRRYYFLSSENTKKRSKFGWVKSSQQPFNLEEFLADHPEIGRSEEQCNLLEELFSAIAKLPDGTPVAGSYFRRGIEHPRNELTFHKVFFYPGRGEVADSEDPRE